MVKHFGLIISNLWFHREAFSGFEAELVADFNEKKIQSIVNDYGINLSQVLAVVDNAKQILKVYFSFVITQFTYTYSVNFIL